jgi:hypothetical protein
MNRTSWQNETAMTVNSRTRGSAPLLLVAFEPGSNFVFPEGEVP